MIRKLARCVGEYKRSAILTPIFIVCEVLLECLIPFIIAELVNRIKAGCEFREIAMYGLTLFLMACLSLTFGALAGATAATASAGFSKNLRRMMYHRIQEYSFENIDRFSSSSLVTRMTTDIQYVQMSFMMIIRIAVRAPIMFLFAIIMAFVMGGPLALMFVIVVPILLSGLLIIAKKAMPMFRRIFKKYDKLNESIEENIKGMRVVKSFVREKDEKQKFASVSEEVRDDFTRADRVVAFNGPLMQFCLYFNMIFVMLVGSHLIVSSGGEALDVGQYSAILTYGFQILSSLMTLSMVYVTLTISTESAKRIVEVLDEESTIVSPENAVKTVKDGSIDFSGVSFKYSTRAERSALEGINLHIGSGQVVGILGGTGSSKSTLVQLIPRLYDVSEGTVKVGGTDVRSYDLRTLRDSVAMVLQKNELFSGTIAENLRWGNKDATDEELREACRLACASEFIDSFPDGYNTKIEQGGTNVSGGQKQRLCIARALLKKPKILILDDSTSAVDTKTDAMIRKGFREFIPETTKIIIAQRVSSVMDADLIVVMDGGRIDAVGTHETLLRENAIYQEVYYSQNSASSAEEEA